MVHQCFELAYGYSVYLSHNIRQTCVVKNVCDRVPHLFHHQSNPAGPLIFAFITRNIGRLTDAWHWSQRPVQDSNHSTQLDSLRLSPQKIAATLSFLALEHPMILELKKYEFQKLLGNAFLFGELRNQNGYLVGLLGKVEECSQPILCLHRKHSKTPYLDDQITLLISNRQGAVNHFLRKTRRKR